MSIAFRYTTIEPQGTVSFEFDGTVLAYLLGIARWSFSYGSKDHHVKKVQLSLAGSLPAPDTVQVAVTAVLEDATGHDIDESDSSITVCCVALLDSSEPNLILAAATGIPDGASAGPFTLPGTDLAVAASFLTGFDLEYAQHTPNPPVPPANDHDVRRFSVAAGFTENTDDQGFITAQAAMCDASGHDADHRQIDGALIAAASSDSGLLDLSNLRAQSQGPIEFDFGTPISDAVVLLQSLVADYGKDDHHVQTLGGGTSGWTIDGTKVCLSDAYAFMQDDSGHHQDDDLSGVGLLILALPSS